MVKDGAFCAACRNSGFIDARFFLTSKESRGPAKGDGFSNKISAKWRWAQSDANSSRHLRLLSLFLPENSYILRPVLVQNNEYSVRKVQLSTIFYIRPWFAPSKAPPGAGDFGPKSR
jgi:hypothetical protein